MKKVLFAIIGIAAACILGCSVNNPSSSSVKDVSSYTEAEIKQLDNKTEKCWRVLSVTIVYGEQEKSESYMWATEQEVAQYCLMAIETAQDYFKQYGISAQVKMGYAETNVKTEEACEKLNKGGSGGGGGGGANKACYYFEGYWKGTDTLVYNAFVWVTEEELADLIDYYETNLDVDVKVTKVDKAKTEEACNEMTPNDYFD